MHAEGKFTVEIQPLDSHFTGEEGVKLGRMSIDKIFEGDLSARSKGEMLSALSSVEGSGGYVAIEQVQGDLAGKPGGFVLQHFGIMSQGQNHLILEVVPGTGSGQLQGLTGKMTIIIENGNHLFKFDYQLPA